MNKLDISRINNTLGKMSHYLGNHKSICVSVSGGSDSDIIVHMIATYFRNFLGKIHFVFVNTGLEYRATLLHLDYLEKRYEIKIDRVKGVPIPLAVKQNGVPFVSKRVSDYLSRLQLHKFDFSNVTVNEGVEKFGRCRAALRWWCNDWGNNSMFNIDRNMGLKEFLMNEKPNIPFSAECCHISKKKPLVGYQRSVDADLIINGSRKNEGGTRASSHNSCFKQGRDGVDLYMPLYYWDNDTKAYYKKAEGIVYSDCYEVWGMRRTGCVGCPFALKREEELSILSKNEPLLYKACCNVFGESYRLMDKFNANRAQIFQSGGDVP